MKILLINKFLYPKGGDAICTLETGRLLKDQGHDVSFWGMKHEQNPPFALQELFVDNVDYLKGNALKTQMRMAANVLYSREAAAKIGAALDKVRPDIVHVHNFAHQISPSILPVIKKRNIPIVMTMHDFKMVCPAYAMLSRGHVCEKCTGGKYFHCALNKCTKGSFAKSALNTMEMYLHHSFLRIYEAIDRFIAPSLFMMEKTRAMGFKGRMEHLSNFVDLGRYSAMPGPGEEYFVYFGRLSREKGIMTLVEAMRPLRVPLLIIGEGPMKEELMNLGAREGLGHIRFPGYLTGEALKEKIRYARAVIVPSECYENNPRSLIESYALGRPVIGARIGGIPELIEEGLTGLSFEHGQSLQLRERILYFLEHPEEAEKMGHNARQLAQARFSSLKHYEGLMQIYRAVISSAAAV
jgi:glycosyltransferase involved in cell wall biosynthesis